MNSSLTKDLSNFISTTLFYSLESIIGKGSFSTVFKAKQIQTGYTVAIKIISLIKSILNEKSLEIEKIENEIRLLQQMNHPNIIKLYEFRRFNEFYILVLEYCSRGDLYKYISESENEGKVNGLNAKDCKECKDYKDKQYILMFYQIVNGLYYLWSNRISHCDLKPQNILISQNFILKISDFGMSIKETIIDTVNNPDTISNPTDNPSFSTNLPTNQHEKFFLFPSLFHSSSSHDKKPNSSFLIKSKSGTLSFSSPEKILNYQYDAYQSDVWSAGIILYYIIYKELPFVDENKERLIRKISLGLFEKDWLTCDNEVIDDIKDLIIRMLTVNPCKRIKVNEILRHRLFKCVRFLVKTKEISWLCKEEKDFQLNNFNKKKSMKHELYVYLLSSIFKVKSFSYEDLNNNILNHILPLILQDLYETAGTFTKTKDFPYEVDEKSLKFLKFDNVLLANSVLFKNDQEKEVKISNLNMKSLVNMKYRDMINSNLTRKIVINNDFYMKMKRKTKENKDFLIKKYKQMISQANVTCLIKTEDEFQRKIEGAFDLKMNINDSLLTNPQQITIKKSVFKKKSHVSLISYVNLIVDL